MKQKFIQSLTLYMLLVPALVWAQNQTIPTAVNNSESETTSAVTTNAVTNSLLPSSTISSDGKLDSKEYVRQAWEASGQGNLEKIAQLVQAALNDYGAEAQQEKTELTGFP